MINLPNAIHAVYRASMKHIGRGTTFTGATVMSVPYRFLVAGLVALPILVASSLSAQISGKLPVGSKVPIDYTAPAPQVGSIGGSPTTTTLTWVAASTGVRLLEFEVSRWFQTNLNCCNARVVIPAGKSSDAKWTDYDFPFSGIYVYRITSVYADGTRGTVQLDYTRPEPVNPAWLAVRSSGLGKWTLTWPEVPQASFYQLWGPGIASGGVTVMNAAPPAPGTTLYQGVAQQIVNGVTHFSLELVGLPVRPTTPLSWSIGSFYEPTTCAAAAMGQPCQKVSTAGTDFTRTP